MDGTDMLGKVVLVTGGSRGVGKGIAGAFLAQGAEVVVCGRRQPDAVVPGRWSFVPADVRKTEQAQALLDGIVQRFGRLDVLVNNAGGSPPADAATQSPRFAKAIIDLNLVAPLEMAEMAESIMRNQPDGGVIINVGSLSGLRPSPGTSAYGAAKAGVIRATESQAARFAPNVRVNCVTPGAVETDELASNYGGQPYIDAVVATVPMGRMGQPADVASACLFLVSDAAAFITGANLVVHGGGDDPPRALDVQP
jgi:NAD(P)-dependent dehydrogenase (short-subunit alcohol dehydrogenase family)